MKVLSLNELIHLLEDTLGVKITICDLTGILQNENLRIDFENRIHTSQMCRLAKSTQKGLKLCTRCKKKANYRVQKKNTSFCGMCAYGIFESAYPVVIDCEIKCIIYTGGFTLDAERSKAKLKRACSVTGVNTAMILKCFDRLTQMKEHHCYDAAKIIESYMILLYSNTEYSKNHSVDWMIQNIVDYIDENYQEEINLKECSEMYFINEKYLGGKFQKKVGMSFRQYLNRVRIENAKKMLISTNKSVTDIAMECGYNDVTYFNRVFKKICDTVPLKFREDNRNV